MIRKFTSKTQQIGQLGEEKAVMFLMKQGFVIVGQNINNRHGEIDIIAKKQKTYYFFEVKAGKQGSWFNPADNLTKEKLWKFFRAVEYYCIAHRSLGEGGAITNYRMQGIVVLLGSNHKETTVEFIELA